jgi:transcriptional regulator with XRE-family HTH domain
MIDVGQRIREAREELGMQTTVLAQRTGVARNTIYRIEAGIRKPSWPLLEKIAKELRVEPAELLKEPDAGKGAAPYSAKNLLEHGAGHSYLTRTAEEIVAEAATMSVSEIIARFWELDEERELLRAAILTPTEHLPGLFYVGLDPAHLKDREAFQALRRELKDVRSRFVLYATLLEDIGRAKQKAADIPEPQKQRLITRLHEEAERIRDRAEREAEIPG